MKKLTEILKVFFKDDRSVKDVFNFIITLIIILAVALLILNVFFEEEEKGTPIIFDSDSQQIHGENLSLEEEQRLSDILSQVKGVGEVKVLLTYQLDENRETTVKGVIIVAEGAGNAVIKNQIISAAQSAFDIPVSRITVMERK